jgi:hypothetical protein
MKEGGDVALYGVRTLSASAFEFVASVAPIYQHW